MALPWLIDEAIAAAGHVDWRSSAGTSVVGLWEEDDQGYRIDVEVSRNEIPVGVTINVVD